MAKIKVFIVDDTKETIDLVKKVLQIEQDKFEIIGEASNGEEALELIPALDPDIVLMDINMPVMNGLEATEKITTEHPSIAVIIMSVQGENEYLRKAMLCGAKEYIVKPFNYNTLLETIVATHGKNMEFLEQFQGEQELEESLVSKDDNATSFLEMLTDVDNLNDEQDVEAKEIKAIPRLNNETLEVVKVSRGFRAVTINVTEGAGASSLLRKDDLVDGIVFIKYELDSKVTLKHSITKMVLQNARVLGVERKFTDMFVTLSVPTEDVEKIVLAQNIGKIILVIRPEHDQNKANTKIVTWKDLIEKMELAQS